MRQKNYEYDHRWRLRGPRHGQRCRVITRARYGHGPHNVLVEFENDKERVVSHRWCVEKIREDSRQGELF